MNLQFFKDQIRFIYYMKDANNISELKYEFTK
jgi:hypothetical protein